MLIWMLLLTIPLAGYLIWHTLGIVLSTIARRKRCCQSTLQLPTGKVALLYLTCNDFNPSACSTLLEQQGIEFDVFVLDDSTQVSERKRIDDWIRNQNNAVRVVRRSDRSGYKGGNVNHWLTRFGDPVIYPFLLILDADEHVPADFARRLLECITSGQYAFAQGCHLGIAELRTPFQALLHPQVECEWLHQVPAWNLFGISPMLGHGVLLRTQSLKAVGGFPDLVSEDLALTIVLAEKGLSGVIATDVIGYEEFPRSYRSYWKRRRRWILADAEVVRKMLRRLRQSHVGCLARLALSARELRLSTASAYWILLLTVAVSGFLVPVNNPVLSPFAWALLPFLLLPALPALTIKRLSFVRRALYVCTVTFVGAATSSLHPIASLQGFLGCRYFEPTGSRHNQAGITLSLFAFWELSSGGVFITSGILSSNWPLVAVGFAIGCSLFMRSRWETQTLAVGVSVFWILLPFQIYVDVSNGFLPIEHLLVLTGLAVNLI